VMHQFLGHESGGCEVPSPIQPFTPTVCDFDETFRQKRAALLWDEEWSAIRLTKSSFLFVFSPVSGEHPITTGTKDYSVFRDSRVNNECSSICCNSLQILLLYRVSHLGRSIGLPDAIWPFVPWTVQAKAIV
jgi:hypothetical protein